MYKNGEPFIPIGATSLIAANAVAPTAVQLAGDATSATMQTRSYRVMNNGAETAFYAYGANATVANTNVVIPTNASVGGLSYPLPAGGIEVITAPAGQYWT